MESVGNTTESLLDAFDPSLAAVPPAVDPTPYAYYGTSQEVEGFDAVNTIVVADHSGTLFMEFSMDNEIWDVSFSYTYPPTGLSAGDAMYKSVPTLAKYYRSGFINTTDFSQNLFRLQTLMHENTRTLSSEFDSVAIGAGSFDGLMNDTNTLLTSIDTTLTNVTDNTNLFYVYDNSVSEQLTTLTNCVTGTTINVTLDSNPVGSKGNIINDSSLSPLASSPAVDISQFKDSIISYEDENATNADTLLIFASTSNTVNTFVCIGSLTPFATADTNFRYAFDVLNLAPFNYLYLYNNSTTDTNTAVTCSIYSS